MEFKNENELKKFIKDKIYKALRENDVLYAKDNDWTATIRTTKDNLIKLATSLHTVQGIPQEKAKKEELIKLINDTINLLKKWQVKLSGRLN